MDCALQIYDNLRYYCERNGAKRFPYLNGYVMHFRMIVSEEEGGWMDTATVFVVGWSFSWSPRLEICIYNRNCENLNSLYLNTDLFYNNKFPRCITYPPPIDIQLLHGAITKLVIIICCQWSASTLICLFPASITTGTGNNVNPTLPFLPLISCLGDGFVSLPCQSADCTVDLLGMWHVTCGWWVVLIQQQWVPPFIPLMMEEDEWKGCLAT